VFRRLTHLYATAAFLGCLVYAGAGWLELPAQNRMVVGVAAILLLRLAGIRWQLSLPEFESSDGPAKVPVER
jgi:uncharacterized membrane protein YeiH